MTLSVVALLAQAKPKFIRAPGHEPPEMAPGEKSMMVIWDGAQGYLTSGIVTFLVLPIMAVVLYRMGYRVAGPIIGLCALGLYFARLFGAPA